MTRRRDVVALQIVAPKRERRCVRILHDIITSLLSQWYVISWDCFRARDVSDRCNAEVVLEVATPVRSGSEAELTGSAVSRGAHLLRVCWSLRVPVVLSWPRPAGTVE